MFVIALSTRYQVEDYQAYLGHTQPSLFLSDLPGMYSSTTWYKVRSTWYAYVFASACVYASKAGV